jgi:rhodanese-related sulfurtransferase
MLAAKSADIFDNNSEERFAKSHVPGARWVAFNKVTASDLPKDKERSLVFYCENTR